MTKNHLIAISILMLAVVSGCSTTSEHIQYIDQPSVEVATGDVEIVFMRPSSYAGAVQASVYDVTDDKLQFIGILSQGTRINHTVAPGEHRFMVIAENADFMEAELDADKTYYALVAPRPGIWRARFSLLPVRKDPEARYSLLKPQFDRWMERTEWAEMSPSAYSWFDANRESIESRHDSFMERWERMAPDDKAVLTISPEDGVVRHSE